MNPEIIDEVTTGQAIVDTSTLAQLQKAEIDQQITTAHAFPRSIKSFREEAHALATMSEDVAQECMFALPRGGKVIEGPSVRMAEIVAHTWGNCRAGTRIVSEDAKFVTAQGVFHDLEKNVAVTCEVKRKITNRQGKRYNDDMITTTSNAACSIALRNAIFKGVPKAFWVDIYNKARKVAVGLEIDLSTRIKKMFVSFVVFGVDEEMILRALELDEVEQITQNHLAVLIGYFNNIKDGEVSIESIFPKPTAAQENVSKLADIGKKPEAAPTSENQERVEPDMTVNDCDVPE